MATVTGDTFPSASAEAAPARPRDPVDTAFGREELYARKLSFQVRVAVVAAVYVFLPFVVTPPAALPYIYGLSVLFVVSSWLHYRLARRGDRSIVWSYVFSTFDVVLLVYIVMVPIPYLEQFTPQGSQLHFGNQSYLYIFIAAAAFTYAPVVVLWTGLIAAIAWWIAVLWILQDPETFVFMDMDALMAMTPLERNEALADFRRIDLRVQAQTSFLFILVAGVVAAFVWRVRRLAYLSVAAERARANLARFFSPNIVDELSHHDEPLRAGRRQDIAVMFTDIVGFTQIAEGRSPDRVLDLLRDVHGMVARQVFAHRGTLDKYLGDGAMATFGTPLQGADDADRALACARAILEDVRAWNAGRGGAPVRLGIGLHYGEVVLGDIGADQRLEYTVIGDTVNVASRLERLTREIGADLVVSDDLYRRVSDAAATHGFVRREPQRLRGRGEPIVVWSLAADGPF